MTVRADYDVVVRGQLTADIEDDLAQVEMQAAQIKTQTATFVPHKSPTSQYKLVALLQTSNLIQRLISGILLGSAVTVYLVLGPRSAPIYLCSFVVSICNYEYAWLAERITHRFTTSYLDDCLGDVHSAGMCAIRPFDGVRRAVSPIACGYPRVAAGILATLLTAGMTLSVTHLAVDVLSYKDSHLGIDEFLVLDLTLYVALTTWLTTFSALLTPSFHCMLNVFFQQYAYGLVTITHYFCFHYDNKCYGMLNTSKGRWLALIFIFGNRLPLLTRVSPAAAIESFVRILLDVIGFAYIVLLMQPIADLLIEVDGADRIALGFLAVVWGTDTGAYVMGHFLKHIKYKRLHPLAKHISPNKDVEGSLGGVALGVGAVLLVDALMKLPLDLTPEIVELQRIHRILFAVVGGLLSRYGDLFASLLKRLAGVKDTGTLIPGHGGLLDRVDALLFVGAVFALYHRGAFAPYYDKRIDASYVTSLVNSDDLYTRLTNAGITYITSP
ncbi:hypothetical protein SPRG_15879 [Saprolegnia parasitica CBS 223.65]|uniref:Phosphatidate cytidylyltransferase n=1 Tax=Saprolegnia parasitica (strain CBS 223.65) TaxID=695850 RepID=A0A067BPY1_SAPPC|nr:hypothetical protein SPRG_15879 [Saprolegnia parasitica CBS 223.65]KDO18830.1 hypothetical protein SPRG_15879 [Saprolegnia parasitica CBS 223.65]|eukprot:XP_012210465.1 hypothetical protein SPRG_15879 [Saprolegnia parasitica CBS 223.65]